MFGKRGPLSGTFGARSQSAFPIRLVQGLRGPIGQGVSEHRVITDAKRGRLRSGAEKFQTYEDLRWATGNAVTPPAQQSREFGKTDQKILQNGSEYDTY